MRYHNPIIPGFYPDPSICRVGGDFYLVTSSFEYFPGLLIFNSRDLVNWRQIGHCLTRPGQLPLDGCRASGAIWAPALRHYDGTFYMTKTNVTGGGHFFITAASPTLVGRRQRHLKCRATTRMDFHWFEYEIMEGPEE